MFVGECLGRVEKGEVERIDHFYMNLLGLAIEFLGAFPRYFQGEKLGEIWGVLGWGEGAVGACLLL